MGEELENVSEKTIDIPKLIAEEIGVEFFDLNPRNKQAKVIFNNEENFSYTENKTITYSLKEPIYLESIKTIFDEKYNPKNLKIIFRTPEKELPYEFIKDVKEQRLTIKNVITSIEFIPNKKMFSRGKISLKKLEFYGWSMNDLQALKDVTLEAKEILEELKTTAAKEKEEKEALLKEITTAKQALEDQHEELDEKIEELQDQVDALVTEREEKSNNKDKAVEELTKVQNQVSQAKNNLESTLAKDTQLSDSINQKTTQISSLNTKIVEEEQKLKDLEKNTSLIAYDVQGFIASAKSNIWIYIVLSILPWILILCVTWYLYKNSFAIAGLSLLNKDQVDLWTVFWTRIPFAIIVSTMLYIAYEISIFFASKIVDLHQKILDLQKVGIIAKDVNEASIKDLEFTDQEIYELRTSLKMDMLRNHLAKDFSKPLEFKVSNPSIFDKLKRKKVVKEKEVTEKEIDMEEED